MSTVTPPIRNGVADAKNTPLKQDITLSQAASAFIMTVALQRNEWAELQSVPGLTVRLDNYRDPPSGRMVLLVAFGSDADSFTGDDATGKIFVNGKDIDELLISLMEEAKKRPATKLPLEGEVDE
jgi:hypothetical protein